jgi:hypothetical protein
MRIAARRARARTASIACCATWRPGPSSGASRLSPRRGACDGWAAVPGFDVLGQSRHWAPVTTDVVVAGAGPPAPLTFFAGAEQTCAAAMLNLLTG